MLSDFIELSLRSTAESCISHPVGYIEAWYVDQDMQQQGVGGWLVRVGEQWALKKECGEMASDAALDNTLSQLANGRLGYQEVEGLVYFRKVLTQAG